MIKIENKNSRGETIHHEITVHMENNFFVAWVESHNTVTKSMTYVSQGRSFNFVDALKSGFDWVIAYSYDYTVDNVGNVVYTMPITFEQ